MSKLALLLVFSLGIVSCNQSGSADGSYQLASRTERDIKVDSKSMNAAPAVNDESVVQPVNKKKIIKDGRMGLKVDDLEKTKSEIDTFVRSSKGYYANESLANTDDESSWQLKIRIPSANLEKFILKIESGAGQITYKEIDARDVTAEFIDLETRLANKRNYLKRYNELLKQAKTVKDILEIEEKTRLIEEEIESAEGRLKYLSDLVDFSTLDLKVTQEKEFKFSSKSHDKFGERFKQSVSNGWNGLVGFTLLMFQLWPLWIILSILLPVWRRFKKRRSIVK